MLDKLKEKLMRYLYAFLILMICVFQFSLYSVNASTLDNKLLAWGFRRGQNHEQAILDIESKKVINEYNGIALGDNNSKNLYLTFDLRI